MKHIADFDPNNVGLKDNNIFGLPTTEEDAQLVLLPVPWEVTVSYRMGTSRAADHIFNAARQIDLYDADAIDAWKHGYYMLPVDKNIRKKSDYLRQCADLILCHLTSGGNVADNVQLNHKLNEINEGGRILKEWVHEITQSLLQAGKHVGLIGGDHSTPLGFIMALSEVHTNFGVLQIDAHCDLRCAYEGFVYSHASIMYNVLEHIPQVEKLVQVGVRDYCNEEADLIAASNGRVTTFFDRDIKEALYEGKTWKAVCQDIINTLPEKVYISFDIDGLDPKLCPNTGTPVPGGFDVEQVYYLFRQIKASGRQIIGFDLNEVSCGDHPADGIDAIVGARALYKLCNLMVS